MLRFKPEVRIERFTPAIAAALEAAAWWSLRARVDVRINSIDDPAAGRVPDSFHGFSLAIDFGTDDESPASRALLAEFLVRELPPIYDVLIESDHVHVECDSKRHVIPWPTSPTAGTK